jgi:predicted NodU family carbamoyl transferase
MLVLGVSAFYHDSAAAIVSDGEIIAASSDCPPELRDMPDDW